MRKKANCGVVLDTSRQQLDNFRKSLPDIYVKDFLIKVDEDIFTFDLDDLKTFSDGNYKIKLSQLAKQFMKSSEAEHNLDRKYLYHAVAYALQSIIKTFSDGKMLK